MGKKPSKMDLKRQVQSKQNKTCQRRLLVKAKEKPVSTQSFKASRKFNHNGFRISNPFKKEQKE